MTSPSDPDQWLDSEDDTERSARAARLRWLVDAYPESRLGFLFDGGWLSKQLLEEVKYCFVYGQFVAAAVLGYALVERLLASEFYAAGRDALERARGIDLLKEAVRTGRITDEEYQLFDNLRALRNPLLHFRPPLADGSLERRWIADGHPPCELIEHDARRVLCGLFRLVARHAL